MKFNKKTIRELQTIYAEEFNEKITNTEANLAADRLLDLFQLLCRNKEPPAK